MGKKSQQRWLWYAIDHATSTILAYVFGRRKDEVFNHSTLPVITPMIEVLTNAI